MTKVTPKKKKDENSGGWIVTFADLMSLLMAFFVMLFSMSSLEVEKFKVFGYSIKQALSSTLILPDEDSEPTPIRKKESSPKSANAKEAKKKMKAKQTAVDMMMLKRVLKELIDKGLVEVKHENLKILIRITAADAFISGSADLTKTLDSILKKLGPSLRRMRGQLVITGHTDNVPLYSSKYRSNWELSAARAYTVIDELLKYKVPKERITLRGYGETKRLVENTNETNRAKNRRVEVLVDQSQDQLIENIKEGAIEGAPKLSELEKL